MTSIDRIGGQYAVGDLEEAILGALRSSGRDLGALRVEDLAPVDHFHMGGLEATLELLGLADPAPGAEVLDVGRVPETTDVLASSDVDVDEVGAVMEYRRLRRYLRAQVED